MKAAIKLFRREDGQDLTLGLLGFLVAMHVVDTVAISFVPVR
jgi:hypothetical protein